MATRFRLNFEQIFGTSAQVLAGGTLTFAISGGAPDQLRAIYQDPALAVTKLNPVVLDSAGKHGDIWLDDPSQYRVILKDAVGIVQPGGDIDPIGGPVDRQAPSVIDAGAVGDGVTDDTDAIQAAEDARAHGQTLFFPPLTYKITAPLTIDKPGVWDVSGATFNSTAGNVVIRTPDFLLNGYGATFNFASGDPASDLDRAIRILGDWTGPYGMASAIAVGDTAFTASSAANAATLSPGDWVICVAGPIEDCRTVDWAQVRSVAGTTVNVTSHFRRIMVASPLTWYRVTAMAQNSGVTGLTINTSNTVVDNVAIDIQIARHAVIQDCTFDVAKGLAWQLYLCNAAKAERNRIKRQGQHNSGWSSTVNSLCAGNILEAQEVPTGGFLQIETGGGFNVFHANVIENGASGAATFFNQNNDFNNFTDNVVNGNGTTIGLYVMGGIGNRSSGNSYINLSEGVRFLNNGANTADANVSDGDRFRKCIYCVTVGGGSNNQVLNLVDDGTNGTRVQDSGTSTVLDIGLGLQLFTPTLTFGTPGNLSVVYSTQVGRYFNAARYVDFQIVVTATPTYTTASGALFVQGLVPIAKIATGQETQVVSGTASGWTKAGYSQATPYIGPGDSRVGFLMSGSGKTITTMSTADVPSGTLVSFIVSGRYEINI